MQNEVQTFYDQYAEKEWARFEDPLGILEFSTGRHLISKYLKGSGAVCDIGAGSGRYCEFLARLGYEATFVDLSPELVAIARKNLSERGIEISDFVCGSATDLSMFDDAQFDQALLMGPMYHLVEKEERQSALSELRRIIKPGGMAVVTYFGSYGMLRLGIADLANRFQNIAELERFLHPASFSSTELVGFTASHFSTPDVIATELKDAGLSVVSYASAQGFAGGIRGDLEKLFDECRPAFDNVVDVAVRYCEDKRFRDLGQHLHYVVSKA